MKIKMQWAIGVALCGWACASNLRAAEVTYTAGYSVQPAGNEDGSFYGTHVDFSITTDGAIGLLAPADLISFDIISDDFLDGSFASDNGTASFSGLYATSTRLSLVGFNSGIGFIETNYYDPDGLDLYYQDSASIGGYSQSSRAGDVFVQGMTAGLDNNYEIGADFPKDIASAPGDVPPAAPEPSTWALMIAGVGIVGAALRFGRISVLPAAA